MSRRGKAIAYALLAAALLGLSWWLQAGLHPLSADGVLRAINGLFYIGVVLTGVGVYRRRGADARFFLAVGIGCLAVWMVLFVLFGGMENAAAPGADTAANLLMLVWTALPLCALMRGTVLSASLRREDEPSRRRLPCVLTVLLWLVIVGLLIAGQILGFVHL